MDAEIRRLTYVPRLAGAKPTVGLPSLMGLPPSLRTADGGPSIAKSTAQPQTQALLQASLMEVERAKAEAQREHAEAVASLQQKSAEELAQALSRQKEALDQQWSDRIARAVSTFEQSRAQYFVSAEGAVVRLALAIARRILYRESHMDPLLLRGAVRVALEHAQEDTGCILEVATERQVEWERWLSSDTVCKIQVRGLEEVPPDHCRLLIGASTAELSVDAQLSEIERGFFDLLQSRPMVRAAEPL